MPTLAQLELIQELKKSFSEILWFSVYNELWTALVYNELWTELDCFVVLMNKQSGSCLWPNDNIWPFPIEIRV